MRNPRQNKLIEKLKTAIRNQRVHTQTTNQQEKQTNGRKTQTEIKQQIKTTEDTHQTATLSTWQRCNHIKQLTYV